ERPEQEQRLLRPLLLGDVVGGALDGRARRVFVLAAGDVDHDGAEPGGLTSSPATPTMARNPSTCPSGAMSGSWLRFPRVRRSRPWPGPRSRCRKRAARTAGVRSMRNWIVTGNQQASRLTECCSPAFSKSHARLANPSGILQPGLPVTARR